MAIRNVPQTYATIAAAVAAASSGDTILIDAGYAGNESVSVTVSGLTFDAPASVTGIVLTAASAGLTIALAGASAITVNGSSGNDVISGNGGANVISNGGGGTDTLSGGAGNDTFQLLDGGEIFYPDGGAGTVDGGAGTDTVRSNDLGDFSFSNVEVLDVAYIPSIFSQFVFATVAQLASFSTITSSDGDTTNRVRLILRGAGGTLDLSTVNTGGFPPPAVTTDGVQSAITVIGTAGDDFMAGSEFDDSLFGEDGNDYLAGGAGADLLDGGDGDDRIVVWDADTAGGGAGNDTFELAINRSGTGTIDGGAGTDRFVGGLLTGFSFTNVEVLDVNSNYVFVKGSLSQLSSFASITNSAGNPPEAISFDLVGAGGTFDFSTGILGTHSIGLSAYELTSGITVTATAGSDLINGTSFDDQLYAGAGNDFVLNGFAGNDLVDGGEGNDRIQSSQGNDTLLGGAGTDTFELSGGSGTVDGGTGADTVRTDHLEQFSVGNVEVLDAWILGEVSATLAQLASFSSITSAHDGANGRITFDLLGAGGTFDFSTGIIGTHSVAVHDAGLTSEIAITGTAGNDVLDGSAFDDRLDGGAGDDRLTGGAGIDLLHGGAGKDSLTGSNDGDTATYYDAAGGVAVNLAQKSAQDTLSAGIDTLIGLTNLIGSAFDDQLRGSPDANRLEGGAGDDTLNGAAGDDILDGGLGDDTLIGGADSDTATYAGATAAVTVSLAIATTQSTGAAGSDTLSGVENLTGSGYNDTLTGSNGANRLEGGAGNDALQGGAGNDTLDGGLGVDAMTGGSGDDLYYVDRAGDQVIEAIGGGTDTVYASADYTLASGQAVETLQVYGSKGLTFNGNEFANTMIGASSGAFADRLFGFAGNDTLNAYGGNDLLHGGAGDDTLDGGTGNDNLNGSTGIDKAMGGAGDDTYTIDSSADQVIELANEGVDTVRAYADFTLSDNVEDLQLVGTAHVGTGNALGNHLSSGGGADTLTGLAGNDRLDGLAGSDLLDGGSGDDRLVGGDGNDTLLGGDGIDRLEGGGGIDTMDGGAGNDTLIGGAGRDIATGGLGADLFTFQTVADFGGSTTSTADRILDFSAAESDRFHLSAIDANANTAANDAFSFIGAAAFSGMAGQLRTFQQAGDTFFAGDLNGDSSADFMVRVVGLHTLTAGNFVL